MLRNCLSIHNDPSVKTSLQVVEASVWPDWEPVFPSAKRAAKENSREDRPGVSWADVQGLIMESVSHKQNSVNSDAGSSASKGIWGKLGESLASVSVSSTVWSSICPLTSPVPFILDCKCECAKLVGKPQGLDATLGSACSKENRSTLSWIKRVWEILHWKTALENILCLRLFPRCLVFWRDCFQFCSYEGPFMSGRIYSYNMGNVISNNIH